MKFKILLFIYTKLFNVMTCILKMMEKCDGKDEMIKNVVVPHMENWIKANKDRGVA